MPWSITLPQDITLIHSVTWIRLPAVCAYRELISHFGSKLFDLLQATPWSHGLGEDGCFHTRAQFNLSFYFFLFGIHTCHFFITMSLQQPSIWSGVVAVISYPRPVSWQPDMMPQATSHQLSCQTFIALDALKITAVISCFSNIWRMFAFHWSLTNCWCNLH